MRVLVFGDSITQGFWDVDGGWVERLRKHYDKQQLEDLKNNDEPVIFNLGVSADTTDEILQRLKNETLARTRHGDKPIVIVQIGVNDSSTDHGREKISLEKYASNLEAIIKVCNEVASKLILIGSSACIEAQTTPTFWGDYHYTNTRIKKYEDAMRQTAECNQVDFIPIFDKFNDALEKEKHLLEDGLHPNDQGHKLIFELVQPELDKLLNL